MLLCAIFVLSARTFPRLNHSFHFVEPLDQVRLQAVYWLDGLTAKQARELTGAKLALPGGYFNPDPKTGAPRGAVDYMMVGNRIYHSYLGTKRRPILASTGKRGNLKLYFSDTHQSAFEKFSAGCQEHRFRFALALDSAAIEPNRWTWRVIWGLTGTKTAHPLLHIIKRQANAKECRQIIKHNRLEVAWFSDGGGSPEEGVLVNSFLCLG